MVLVDRGAMFRKEEEAGSVCVRVAVFLGHRTAP
jgi:hypothetical protein